MPNVLLFVQPAYESTIKLLMPQLGPVLCRATAEALGDVTEAQVAIMALPIVASHNATPMQIFAIGSDSTPRRKRHTKWRLFLAEAWRNFALEHQIPWGELVDVWPILPPGMWMMTDHRSISARKEDMAKAEE